MIFRHLKKRHLLFMETIMLSWKFLRPITLVRAPMFLVSLEYKSPSKTRGCFRLLLLTAEILSYLYVVDEISRGFPEMIIWEYWYFFYTKSINLFFQNKPSRHRFCMHEMNQEHQLHLFKEVERSPLKLFVLYINIYLLNSPIMGPRGAFKFI